MGYTTEFEGSIQIEPPLNAQEISFLRDFNHTRRMNRTRGPLFVRGSGFYGQGDDPDIINHNQPHPDQPGLWCQWTPNEDGTAIVWDGGEKFYSAPEWMMYIISFLLSPIARPYIDAHLDEDPRLASFTCDHVLNGVIFAQGEDDEDQWELRVISSLVFVSNLT